VDNNERFEILGELYHRRFHRLRPGKDESGASHRDSSEPENVRQFATWYGEGCEALEDALEYISWLRDQL
jgi:hypothetical protein